MILGYVEPSGESGALARAEIAAAVRALGGRSPAGGPEAHVGLVPVLVPDREALLALTSRLALARRCLLPVGEAGLGVSEAAHRAGADGGSASFRRLGAPSGPADVGTREAGRQFVAAGGSIDLEQPQRRFWIARTSEGSERLLVELGTVDRHSFTARAMPRLPFQRPVSLPPRLARAAANLAGIRPGDHVLDPFLGTGALLAEAALLGARVYGIDRDLAMLRGALGNLAHLGVTAEALAQGDAREVEVGTPGRSFDAILTDPPYGRSSGAGGEDPRALARAVLDRWQRRVVPGGPIVVVVPGGPPTVGPPWTEEECVAVRVHRSLTREFRRYVRRP